MLHEKTRQALWDCNSASYAITPEGLEFSIDTKTQRALKKLQKLEEKGEPVGFHTDELFIELIESCLCNGLSLVRPEVIGALTSSLILTEGDVLDAHGDPDVAAINESKFYWYPNYAIRSPLEDLTETRKVTFTE